MDVRLDSRPSGATVMLVDNGRTSFLGTTPVSASLDRSRGYDVIFTLAGHPTTMAHVDPARTTHVDIALAGSKAATPAPAPAARHHHHHVVRARHDGPKGALADPFGAASRPAHHARTKIALAAPTEGGTGTLMVSTKPPCELVIDGRRTGLVTPQRSIPLASGTHHILFVNAAEHIRKTITVSIRADHSTKLIQNLMH